MTCAIVLRCALCFTLLAGSAAAQDALTQANEAYRQGDLRKAAQLFGTAAEAETDAARRADIRVKQAWMYFNVKNRTKAEEVLAAALTDAPQLELLPDFYTDDFLTLFNRVRSRLASQSASPAPAAPPLAPRTAPLAGSLAPLRQKLAMAVDNPALEAILGEVEVAATGAPPALMPDVLEIRAEVLERLGRTTEALEQRGRVMALRAQAQAVAGAPPVPLDALQAAQLLLAQGQPQDAEAVMRGVLAVLPACVEAYAVQGEALLEGGKLDQAFSHLRTAMLGGEKPELWRLLGEVELRRGHLAQAREAFRHAAEGNPADDRAWAALGLLATRMDDTASAREALDKALQANGTLFEARVVRAQLALAEGQTSAAFQHLQIALRQKPDDPWALGWLGVTYLAAGNPGAAVDKLRLAGSSASGVFPLALGEALRRAGKPQEALEALAGLRTGDPALLFLRARCLLDAGQVDEAMPLLQGLALQTPEDPQVHYLLGYALHRQREWRLAVVELSRAAALAGAPPLAKEAVTLAAATFAAQGLMDAAQPPPPPPPQR